MLKSKDRGFKTAPDGRLIITVDNEKDEAEAKKKRKPLFLHSDSEDDYGKMTRNCIKKRNRVCLTSIHMFSEEDDDVISVATSQGTGKKRKRNTFDNVSARSGATSMYQGKRFANVCHCVKLFK